MKQNRIHKIEILKNVLINTTNGTRRGIAEMVVNIFTARVIVRERGGADFVGKRLSGLLN